MRWYLYINKSLIRCIAAELNNISLNIDVFEYSEKVSYTTNCNTNIRPGIENNFKYEQEKCEKIDRTRVDVSGEKGKLYNVQIEKRYINIEDISMIKNNGFYYKIIENLEEDKRVKNITGIVENIVDNTFYISNNKVIIDKEEKGTIDEIREYKCELNVLGYRINCIEEKEAIYKAIALYIE